MIIIKFLDALQEDNEKLRTVETKCERNLYKEALLLWVSRKAEDGTQDLIVSQNIRNH